MEVVDTAQINSFASQAMQCTVPPAEEPVFILTSSQLQDLITRAVEKAIQPLQDEVRDLKAIVARQDEKIAALEATQNTHAENSLIQLKLINNLREATKKEPQPLQKDRGEILRALLAANGGKMLAKDARKKMRLDEATFSRLLDASEEHIEKRAYHLDKRQSVLIIK